jgi:poly-gamma-glutamate synthesis protein (capsule biosynthesis protein)
VRIVSVGDVIPHLDLQQYALSNKQKFDVLFDRLGDSIKKADLAIANFEATTDSDRKISGYPRFNAHPALMKAMKRAGFGLLSLANNHSLDWGSTGLLSTLKTAGRYRLRANGISKDVAGSLKPSTLRIKGIKIAFLSLTTFSNRKNDSEGDDGPQLFFLNRRTQSEVRKSIRRMARRSDLVVVAVHFDKQYIDAPTAKQRRWARRLASWGADIVLGNHSHHIQRPEWFASKGGRRTLVSYSQGNFISHQNRFATINEMDHDSAKRGDSFLLNIDIRKTGKKTEILRFSYTPTWTLCFSHGNDFGFKAVVLAAEIRNPLHKGQLPLLIRRRKRIVKFMKGFALEE